MPETLLIELLNKREEEALLAQPLTPEELAFIERAIAEGEAGLGIPFEEYIARGKAERAARKAARLAAGEPE